MTYGSIFDTKPKKENIQNFCARIVSWLNELEIFYNNEYITDGERIINLLFKYSKFNNGFSSIDDLLHEASYENENIFSLSKRQGYPIEIWEVLPNIDIIINSLSFFENTEMLHYRDKVKSFRINYNIMKAIKGFLLSNGFRLEKKDNDKRIKIVENNACLNISSINNEKIKDDVLNFYDYKNSNDITEKQKIIVSIIHELEGKKQIISNILGKDIASIFSNYVNNFNLRHNNVTPNQKYYHEKIASLSDREILEWWNYIFAFLINIYVSIEKLKDVNINNGYK